MRCILRKGVILPAETSLCLMQFRGENFDHLMCHCQFSSKSWDFFLGLMGCRWVLSGVLWDVMIEWASGPFRGEAESGVEIQ